MGTDRVLCLITGPSGSGKTTIASELQNRLSFETKQGDTRRHLSGIGNRISVVVIHQDHYFTKPFLPYKERVDDSYENGSGIDWDGLFTDVQSELEQNPTVDGESVSSSRNNNLKIIIVEGHLLGDATAQFRKRFFRDNIGIVGIFLMYCSKESCKYRRIERNQDRSEEEREELAAYIDSFVWPSFVKYGGAAMTALRQSLVETGAAPTPMKKCTDASVAQLEHDCTNESHHSVRIALDIDNSENGTLEETMCTILGGVREFLSR